MGRADLLDTMTVPEVAERLRVDAEYVRAMIRGKKIKAFKLGREYRITESELEAFIEGLQNHIEGNG